METLVLTWKDLRRGILIPPYIAESATQHIVFLCPRTEDRGTIDIGLGCTVNADNSIEITLTHNNRGGTQ